MSKRKTHEEFLNEISKFNNNITILSEYTTRLDPIKCKCNICNQEFEKKPRDMLLGQGCMFCSKIKQSNKLRKSKEDFINELKDINPNIVILGEYVNALTHIDYFCKKCGCYHSAKPSNLLTGYGCPTCERNNKIGRNKKSHEQFLLDLLKVDNTIKIISKYNGSFKKIKCQCKICNHIWENTPTHLLSGEGCPACVASVGENRILNYLNQNNINYEYQKKFPDLIGLKGGCLSYDFYIPNINLLIEYQGQFHDGSVDFQTKEEYNAQVIHDNIKKEYAYKNSMELLEIWYWDLKNIYQILNNIFT